MRASEGARPCQEARVYYYDLLGPDGADVPAPVRQHVATCPYCREQMDRLREELAQGERVPGGGGASEEIVETLAEQFQLLDERVTCSEAKPCLPQLALAVPQIKIPTPITVHVDHCPECAKDVAALRRLQVTADQARRLSQFLASPPGQGVWPWPESVRVRPHLASGSTGDGALGPEVMASGCGAGAVMTCHDISAADIFDTVIPFGAPPGERREAVTAHIDVCPVCRGRVERLQRAIRRIVEREDSEIETVYHTAEDTADGPAETPDTYQYPVSVEIVHAASAANADDSRGAWRSQVPRLRRSAAALARVAVVGLVVVAWAALTPRTIPTASGTHAGDMLKTVAKAPNVHIVRTDSQGGLVQEVWIARHSNHLVYRQAQECVVYEFGRNRKRTIEPQEGIGAPTELSKAERDSAKELMTSCLLDVLEQVSPDTKLHPAMDGTGEKAGGGLDVYEVEPTRQAGNSRVRSRWWTYIDRVTGLPHKVEFYRRGPSDPDWRLATTTLYTYPSEQEMAGSMRAFLTAD